MSPNKAILYLIYEQNQSYSNYNKNYIDFKFVLYISPGNKRLRVWKNA